MATDTELDWKDIAIDMWTEGSYDQLAREILPAAAALVEVADISSTDDVLDVACGSGNAALTAWRMGAKVTGTDLVPRMLELARANAELVGADDIAWEEANAEALPFPDASFDAVLSCFGHIACLDPAAAGRELVRVTRPGGRLAYTSWTPDGLTRPLLQTIAEYLPPGAPDSPADFLWADPAVARDRLGDDISELTVTTDTVSHRFLSPEHFWAHMTAHGGPFIVMRQRVPEADRPALDAAVADALRPFFDDNALKFEYALVTASIR